MKKLTAKQRAKIYRQAGNLIECNDIKGVHVLRNNTRNIEFPELNFFSHEFHVEVNGKNKLSVKEKRLLRVMCFYLAEQIALRP